MEPIDLELLAKIAEREAENLALRDRLIKADRYYRERRIEPEMTADFGPLWDPGHWFGFGSDTAWAKRYQRAAHRLIVAGLIKDVFGYRKLTRLKVTPAGYAALREPAHG